jgi:hypothetical protein
MEWSRGMIHPLQVHAVYNIYRGIPEPLIIEALALRDPFIYSVQQSFQHAWNYIDKILCLDPDIYP